MHASQIFWTITSLVVLLQRNAQAQSMILRAEHTNTPALEDLKRRTEISDKQLDTEIIEYDFHVLAGFFDQVESFLYNLGLTADQRTDLKKLVPHGDTHIAMTEALKLWRQPNLLAATFKTLVKILLDMRRGDVALNVCKYIAKNIQSPTETA